VEIRYLYLLGGEVISVIGCLLSNSSKLPQIVKLKIESGKLKVKDVFLHYVQKN
jgi:hypothetical protein